MRILILILLMAGNCFAASGVRPNAAADTAVTDNMSFPADLPNSTSAIKATGQGMYNYINNKMQGNIAPATHTHGFSSYSTAGFQSATDKQRQDALYDASVPNSKTEGAVGDGTWHSLASQGYTVESAQVKWPYLKTDISWTATGATLTGTSDAMRVTSIGNDPIILTPLVLVGSTANKTVTMTYQKSATPSLTDWNGNLVYQTVDGDYGYISLPKPATNYTDYNYTFDMTQATGAAWVGAKIAKIIIATSGYYAGVLAFKSLIVDGTQYSNYTGRGEGESAVLDSIVKSVRIYGAVNNGTLSIRLKRVAGSGWDGFALYNTFKPAYYTLPTGGTLVPEVTSYGVKSFGAANPAIGEWVTINVDLSSGGSPAAWIDNYITGLRIDLGTSSADVFDIDYVTLNGVDIATQRHKITGTSDLTLYGVDWAGIQNGVTKQTTQSKPFYVSTGSYIFERPLRLPTSSTLIGDENYKPSITGTSAIPQLNGVIDVAGNYVTVKNLSLYDFNTNGSGVNGLSGLSKSIRMMYGVTNTTVRNCNFGYSRHGIYMDHASDYLKAYDNVFYPVTYPIYLFGLDSSYFRDITVENNRFDYFSKPNQDIVGYAIHSNSYGGFQSARIKNNYAIYQKGLVYNSIAIQVDRTDNEISNNTVTGFHESPAVYFNNFLFTTFSIRNNYFGRETSGSNNGDLFFYNCNYGTEGVLLIANNNVGGHHGAPFITVDGSTAGKTLHMSIVGNFFSPIDPNSPLISNPNNRVTVVGSSRSNTLSIGEYDPDKTGTISP